LEEFQNSLNEDENSTLEALSVEENHNPFQNVVPADASRGPGRSRKKAKSVTSCDQESGVTKRRKRSRKAVAYGNQEESVTIEEERLETFVGDQLSKPSTSNVFTRTPQRSDQLSEPSTPNVVTQTYVVEEGSDNETGLTVDDSPNVLILGGIEIGEIVDEESTVSSLN